VPVAVATDPDNYPDLLVADTGTGDTTTPPWRAFAELSLHVRAGCEPARSPIVNRSRLLRLAR